MTKLKRNAALAALPAMLVFIGLFTPKAEAEVTWNYAGNETTACTGANSCPANLLTDALNLSVTFSGPLEDSQSDVDYNALSEITSWTLTDTHGYIDFSSATDSIEADFFSTDANGNIIDDFGFEVYGPGWPSTPGSAAALISSTDLSADIIGIDLPDGTGYLAESSLEGHWSLAWSLAPPTTLLMAMGAGILLGLVPQIETKS